MKWSLWVLIAVALFVFAAAGFPPPQRADAAGEPPVWVNSTTYGSAGGGFYWDFTSSTVWTAERGWHSYAPTGPASPTLWVNYPSYGSAGAGFYLDTQSGQVWTAERGWHLFSPTGVAPTQKLAAVEARPAFIAYLAASRALASAGVTTYIEATLSPTWYDRAAAALAALRAIDSSFFERPYVVREDECYRRLKDFVSNGELLLLGLLDSVRPQLGIPGSGQQRWDTALRSFQQPYVASRTVAISVCGFPMQ